MASAAAKTYLETGAEPEFFVSELKFEDAGQGNMRVYAYSARHQSEMHLLFSAVVPATTLVQMARQAMRAASETHNTALWADWPPGDPH